MIIDTSKLHSLWLENDQGEVWTYPPDGAPGDEPPGFIYQHSMFAHQLTHSVLRAVLPEEVEACDHEPTYIKRTGGWIDGVKGRECMLCKGTQVCNEDEPWPEKWDANGSRQLCGGSSTFPVGLALALSRPSMKERLIAASRGFFFLKTYPLDLAIRIAADNCERCLNVLLWKYGQNDGYPIFSEEWHKAGTACHFCEHLGPGDFWKDRRPSKLEPAEQT
jgi:hypothetical protein